MRAQPGYISVLQTCGEVVYAGLVKREETWYDVVTARPALWADWASGASDDSYSDCAQLDIKTGEEEEGERRGIFLDICCDDCRVPAERQL